MRPPEEGLVSIAGRRSGGVWDAGVLRLEDVKGDVGGAEDGRAVCCEVCVVCEVWVLCYVLEMAEYHNIGCCQCFAGDASTTVV